MWQCLWPALAGAQDLLSQKIEDYQAGAASMAPKEAAQILDYPLNEWMKEPGEITFADFLKALPKPDAWPALADLLRKTPTSAPPEIAEIGSFIAATLENSEQKQWDALFALGAMMKSTRPPIKNVPGLIGQILRIRPQQNLDSLRTVATNLASLTDDPKLFEQATAFLIELAGKQPRGYVRLELPDLVSMLGEEKARQILRQLFTETEFQISISAGSATEELARKITLESIGQLKSAQWELLRRHPDHPAFRGDAKTLSRRVYGL